MRNYWRYVAYIWRHKVRLAMSLGSGFLAEGLNFASVGALIATVSILLNVYFTGDAGTMAAAGPFQHGLGRHVLDYLCAHARPADVLMRTIVLVGLGFLLVAAVRGLLDFVQRYALQSASLLGWTAMTTDLFDRVTGLSMRYFTAESLGGTMSTFGPDLSELRNGGRAVFEHAVREPFKLLMGLGLTVWLSWRLSLITFVALPISAYLIKIAGSYTRRYTRKGLKKRADAMRILGESIQGAAVIKAHNAEGHQAQRFRASAAGMLHYLCRRALVRAVARPATELLYWACRIAVALYGVHLVIATPFTLEALLAFFYCVKQVYDPLSKLRRLYTEVQRCRAAAGRVFAVMDLAPEVADKPDAVDLPPHDVDVRFDHVSFAYDPPNAVVRDFDLTVRRGEVVALVGENGSGKTTVLNLLLRFYDPTDGAVRIDGADLRDVTLASLRRQIGYVAQSVLLFNDTVRNNIAFGDAGATDEQVAAAARAAQAHDFIVGELPDGYATVVGEGGAKLSGGQRQRLALARALLRDPRSLLLDEATSALDVEAEDRLQHELARFARGRTVFLISHRFSALRLADRIVAMAGGRIERIGTHAELLDASPTYRRLHAKQHFAGSGERPAPDGAS